MNTCPVMSTVSRALSASFTVLVLGACGGADKAKPASNDATGDVQLPAGDVDAAGQEASGDATADASTGNAPSPPFAPFCEGAPWTSTLEAGVVGELHGTYKGVLSGLGPNLPFAKGSAETMKIVPQHPFRVTAIRAAFAKGTGPVKLRLQRAWGRSYPGLWPKSKDESLDVIPPMVVEVTEASEEMQEFPLPGEA